MYEVQIKIKVDDIPEAEELLELSKKLEVEVEGVDVTQFSITKIKEGE